MIFLFSYTILLTLAFVFFEQETSLSCDLVLALLSPQNALLETFCILPNYSYLTQKDPPWPSPTKFAIFTPFQIYFIPLVHLIDFMGLLLSGTKILLFIVYSLSSTLGCKHHKCENLNELMSAVSIAPCTVIATFNSFKFFKFPFGKKIKSPKGDICNNNPKGGGM